MHELSVTQRILEICLEHAGNADQITDITLVIGQLSSMVDDSVQYYWHIISAGTIAEHATLHFKRIPAEMTCIDCHTCYELRPDQFTCPTCGSADVRITAGDEFYIESIEIGEPHENPGG